MSPRSPSQRRDEILLSIGGVVAHLELLGAQPVFMEQLRARYGAFELPAAPRIARDFSLRLTLESAAPPGVAGRRPTPQTHPLVVSATGVKIAAERWDFAIKL